MKQLIACLLAVSTLGGCYLGRSPERKVVAYGASTALLGLGVAGLASANGDEAQIATMLSLVPLVVGLAGIAINLAADAR